MTLLLAAHAIVHVNALLNATATVLLLIGFWLIKRGRVEAHKRTMLLAFAVSTAFLACYLWYHVVMKVGSVRFTHPGVVRYVYLVVLWTHIPLAFTVPFLAIWTIYLGLRATGCCTPGDCPLFLSTSDASPIADDQEKGTVPLPNSPARLEGDCPLFAADDAQRDTAGAHKKGTVPAAAYRDKHIRLARWTFPIWLYVSVTGVVVYVMLYHLWPPSE